MNLIKLSLWSFFVLFVFVAAFTAVMLAAQSVGMDVALPPVSELLLASVGL